MQWTRLVVVLVLAWTSAALALRTGASGNAPVEDRNWPAGAVEVANLKTRVGWWEGPGFLVEQWQFLYRGSTQNFQVAVDAFAQIDAPKLVLVVYQGPGDEVVPGQEGERGRGVDWVFLVSGAANVQVMGELPGGKEVVGPPTLQVYVAGAGGGTGIDFAQIHVPEKVTVQDRRATSVGYKAEDASVVRGHVTHLGTGRPMAGAEVVIGTRTQNDFAKVKSVRSGEDGRFEVRQVPVGTYEVRVSAEGYAPRTAGYRKVRPNGLEEVAVSLAPAERVSGTVVDLQGRPVEGVTVRAGQVVASDGNAYASDEGRTVTSDAQGRFAVAGLPKGEVQLHAYGNMRLSAEPLKRYAVPVDGIVLKVVQTGGIRGKVANWKEGGESRSVHVEPEGGSKVGTWGGSKHVSADGSFAFDGVPPGKYVVKVDGVNGAKTVEVKGGEVAEVGM